MQDVLDSSLAAASPVEAATQPFVGRWNKLVSTTNWEKGRIVFQWRGALIASGAAAAEYADDAWAARVSGVTGQHVGRLRRVFERFGEAQTKFAGLYWSHFQAALDWDDAEMWLEGAVQSGWSVALMRQTRFDTLKPAGEAPPQASDLATDADEDYSPETARSKSPDAIEGSLSEVSGPFIEGPDFGDEDERQRGGSGGESASDATTTPAFQPFANMAALPDDMAEAFDAFKLSILRQRSAGWPDLKPEETLAALDGLKALVLAPSEASDE